MSRVLLALAALLVSTAALAQTPCNARVTTGNGTLTFNGAVYRIDSGGAILRNDVSLGGGMGSVLVVVGGELQTLGTDNNWYRYGADWSRTNAPDPCPAAVVKGTRLGWDQAAANLADAQTLAFRFYRDGASVGVLLTDVVCTAAPAATPGVFPCSAAMPSDLPGVSRTVQLTAGTGASESPKSAVYGYVYQALGSARNVTVR